MQSFLMRPTTYVASFAVGFLSTSHVAGTRKSSRDAALRYGNRSVVVERSGGGL